MSKLSNIKKTTLQRYQRFCFYGPEAVGKTTLAAHAPEPIFFDIEGGSSNLPVARYPFRDEPGGHIPRTYGEVLAGIADLLASDHPYQTLVIDTVDALEGLVHNYVIERDSKPGGLIGKKSGSGDVVLSLESYDYGKGYGIADAEFKLLFAKLDELNRRMHIMLVGHAQVKRFANPDGEDFDRYQLRLQDSDKISVARRTKEWVDVLGFIMYEQGAAKEKGDRKAKGYSSGNRLVKFERTHAYDAKSRIVLPQELVLQTENPWAPIANAMAVGISMAPEQIVELINVELARIGDDELTRKVGVAIADAQGHTAKLGSYLNNLKTRESKKEAAAA